MSEKKEKRTEKITITLTKNEKERIMRQSKKYGLKMSPFLRFKGLSDFALVKTKGIERLRKVPSKEDPLKTEIRLGFQDVVKELKKCFEEQKRILRPIPPLEKLKIMKHKQERMKNIRGILKE